MGNQLNGDTLGRVGRNKPGTYVQFVITRYPGVTGTFTFLPVVGWLTVERVAGYQRPTGCSCRYILRSDDATFAAYLKASRLTIKDPRERYVCECFGHYIE